MPPIHKHEHSRRRVFDHHGLVDDNVANQIEVPHEQFLDHLLSVAKHQAHRTHLEAHELANTFIVDKMHLCLFQAYERDEGEGRHTLHWLMNNLVIDLLSDPHRRLASLGVDTLLEARDDRGPLDRLLEEEETNLLLAVIATLSPRDRELLWLKYGAEKNPREIAEAMHMSENNINVALWRARQIVQLQLESLYNERRAG